jgi:hypothetical protein
MNYYWGMKKEAWKLKAEDTKKKKCLHRDDYDSNVSGGGNCEGGNCEAISDGAE